MSIVSNGKRFSENKYRSEKEFEDEVVASSKPFFGKSTIFINAKKKIESKSLGGTVPDGFFFDFADPTDPQFYIVEVELASHGFYSHIFPQITKFFAFFKNTKLQKSLVDKLFSIINTDDTLRAEFKKHLSTVEIYKFLSDIVESSQNILLITDGSISELPEIMDTYTDTWGKLVKCLEIRRYTCGSESVYFINPDIESIQYIEGMEDVSEEEREEEAPKYSEQYYLEDVTQAVRDVYAKLKEIVTRIDSALVLNYQKYYISIKASKNIAFIKFRVKKVRFIALMPEADIRAIITHYPVASLSQ